MIAARITPLGLGAGYRWAVVIILGEQREKMLVSTWCAPFGVLARFDHLGILGCAVPLEEGVSGEMRPDTRKGITWKVGYSHEEPSFYSLV